jgi:hypothetical protein
MSKFSAPDIIDRSPGPVAGLSFGQESIVSAGVIEGAEDIGQFQPAPLTRCRSSFFIELNRLFWVDGSGFPAG